MASDAKRVHVGVIDVTVNKITSLSVDNLGDIQDTITGNIGLSTNGKPGVYAIDLMTGNLAWEQHPTHTYNDPEKGALLVNSIYSARCR